MIDEIQQEPKKWTSRQYAAEMLRNLNTFLKFFHQDKEKLTYLQLCRLRNKMCVILFHLTNQWIKVGKERDIKLGLREKEND